MARIIIDVNRCLGCGWCVDLCEPGVFFLANGHAEVTDSVDACTECGLCEEECPESAIKIFAAGG